MTGLVLLAALLCAMLGGNGPAYQEWQDRRRLLRAYRARVEYLPSSCCRGGADEGVAKDVPVE